MAIRSDVLTAAEQFRDDLFKASEANVFSPAEQDGFSRLLGFYQDRLEAFRIQPRYGDDSAYYDNPLHWATVGAAAVPGCLPGQPSTQQVVYDAANKGGDSLDAVTSPASSGGLLSFRGALVVSTPKTTRPVSGGSSQLAAGGSGGGHNGNNGGGGPSSFGLPPTTPPPAGGVPMPPPGPVPPPKKVAGDPSWFAKLMTMFPAEAVTAYLTGSQYFNGGSVWLVVLTLVAVILVRTVALMSPTGKPNLLAVGVSGVSFLLWVGATADATLSAQVQSLVGDHSNAAAFAKSLQKAASFVILLWTWVVPALIKVNRDA